MTRIAQLQAAFLAAKTERERAAIELETWNARPPSVNGSSRRNYLRATLPGSTPYSSGHRATLYNCGGTAEPLWNRIETDMTTATAVMLVQEAKRTKKRDEPIHHALQRVLSEYDALPHVRNMEDGKVTRHRSPASKRQERGAGSPAPTPKTRAPRERTAPGETVESQDDDKMFWSAMRALIGPYVRRRLQWQSETVVRRELERFEVDLKSTFEMLSRRISEQKKLGSLSDATLRRQLNSACRTLRLDPPKKTVDKAFEKQAQKQFKVLARQYHPDTNGGSNATRPQYDAVLEAWAIVQQFVEIQVAAGGA